MDKYGNCGFRLYKPGSTKVRCSLAYGGLIKPDKICEPEKCPIWQIYLIVTRGKENE